jgi:hypothetical protein
MKLINKQQVSHVSIFKETEGVWCSWGYWAKLKYVPYRKHKWLEFDEDTKEGFYEDGNAFSSSMFRSKDRIEKSKELFIRDNSVWTFPFIQVFCGKDLIHEEYFKSYEDLEQHVKENYDNCTIKYGK